MGAPLVVYTTVDHDVHDTPAWHPEHHARLEAALAGIAAAGLTDATEVRDAPAATVEDLALVHDPRYIDAVRSFCEAGGGDLDGDTVAGPGSYTAAGRAAGAVLAAVDALRAGETDLAFAAARPPGHHAVRDRAMGFCLFNNAAVAAARIAAGGERVAIVDWDVHHGNGTQDIFYDDPRVLYVSTHESPLYPGTGRLRETGSASAPRTTLNLPFAAGTRGDTYRQAFDEVVVPVVEAFEPDWLLVSAGFDAHRDDPLAGIELTAADYADLALRLAGASSRPAAPSWCSRAATTAARSPIRWAPRCRRCWAPGTAPNRRPPEASARRRSPPPASSGISDRPSARAGRARDGVRAAERSSTWTTQAEPRPMTWVRPTLAPSIWRSPASPRRWVVTSNRLATPVAPSGWPLESRPPDTLTGISPSRHGPRRSMKSPAPPRSHRLRLS